MLSQKDDNSIFHPVAFFLKQMVPAECNYKIYNKKLLTIIWCFKEWRPELENTAMPVKMLTDHKGLEYFITTKKLTLTQAGWAEFLSEFNFKVTYQTVNKNNKANALTRKPNKQPISNEDDRQKHKMQVLLPPECIKIQPIEITNEPDKRSVKAKPKESTKTTRNESIKAKHKKPKKEAEELKKLYAAEPHAEPHAKHKESVKTKDLLCTLISHQLTSNDPLSDRLPGAKQPGNFASAASLALAHSDYFFIDVTDGYNAFYTPFTNSTFFIDSMFSINNTLFGDSAKCIKRKILH